MDVETPEDEMAVETLADLQLIDELVASDAVFSAPGIEERQWINPREFTVIHDALTDGAAVFPLQEGEAVVIPDVSVGFVLCARGRTADGVTIAGMYEIAPDDLGEHDERNVAELIEDMQGQGADDVELFILGGEVSLIVPPGGTPARQSSFATIGALIDAAGDRLVSARIGLTETESDFELEAGFSRAPSTGRPESVNVYVTQDAVFYVAEQ